MNIRFSGVPIPELVIEGQQLAVLGFGVGIPLQLTLRAEGLWLTVVSDNGDWQALCEASQYRQDIGADWMRDNGELVIAGEWLTASGISDAESLEVTAAPGVIRLRQRRFKA